MRYHREVPCGPSGCATWVIFPCQSSMMVAQKGFRRLHAPELLARVYAGPQQEDGFEVAKGECHRLM